MDSNVPLMNSNYYSRSSSSKQLPYSTSFKSSNQTTTILHQIHLLNARPCIQPSTLRPLHNAKVDPLRNGEAQTREAYTSHAFQ